MLILLLQSAWSACLAEARPAGVNPLPAAPPGRLRARLAAAGHLCTELMPVLPMQEAMHHLRQIMQAMAVRHCMKEFL